MSKRAALIQLTSDNADEESGNGEDVSATIILMVAGISSTIDRVVCFIWILFFPPTPSHCRQAHSS